MSESDPDAARKRDAAKRAAKGSVQEAIGTLIGDDAARARGRAEKGRAEQDADTAANTDESTRD